MEESQEHAAAPRRRKQPPLTSTFGFKVTAMAIGMATGSYDLTVVNYVILVLTITNQLTSWEKSIIATASIVGTVLGQVLFGYLGDKLTRKKTSLITCSLLFIGAVGSAFASFPWVTSILTLTLSLWRVIVGLGVGGEYPVTAVFSGENAGESKDGEKGKSRRGTYIAAMFSFQGVGNLCASAIFMLLLIVIPLSRLSYIWRLSLALGAIPPLLLFLPRYKMRDEYRAPDPPNTSPKEESIGNTPVLLNETEDGEVEVTTSSVTLHSSPDGGIGIQMGSYGDGKEEDGLRDSASSSVNPFADSSFVQEEEDDEEEYLEDFQRPHHRSAPLPFIVKYYGWTIMGTAGTWFLFDIVFYANTLFASPILAAAGLAGGTGPSSLLETVAFNTVINLIALPGYWAGAFLIDRIGRKPMTVGGLALMGVLYFLIGLAYHPLLQYPWAFVLLYSLSFFAANAGPNTSTFVLPTEVFPANIRSRCHGLSAASGKVGAMLGSFVLSPIVDATSPQLVFQLCGVLAFLAVLCSLVFITESKNNVLEDLDKQYDDLLTDYINSQIQKTETGAPLDEAATDEI